MELVHPFSMEEAKSHFFDSVESFSCMVVPLATWRVTREIYLDSEVAEARCSKARELMKLNGIRARSRRKPQSYRVHLASPKKDEQACNT
jgi:hypothetical protein